MSDTNEFAGDEGTESTQDSGKALRKFAEEQKKRAEALEKQLAELTSKLAARDAEAVFEKLGVSSEYRELYSGEKSEVAITEWVGKWGKLFGIEQQEEDKSPEQQQQESGESRLFAAARQGTTPSARSAASLDAAAKEFKSSARTKTQADLEDFLSTRFGIPASKYNPGG